MKGTLLVVDDEANICSIVARAFEGYGYVCDAADGVAPAMKLLDQGEYDILLADKNMPGSDSSDEGGMELLRWVRDHHPDVAVLILTGHATVSSAVEALKLGAFDYLEKPFDVARLRQKVDRLQEYRTFVNPEVVIDLRLNLFRDLLETADSVSSQSEERLTALKDRLDDLFHAFRILERTTVDQRQRLAEIAAFAEQSRDGLAASDPARHILDHVFCEASRRV